MNVGKYQITRSSDINDHNPEDPNNCHCFSTKLEIMNEIKDIITESIISNTDVYLTVEDEEGNHVYEPKG